MDDPALFSDDEEENDVEESENEGSEDVEESDSPNFEIQRFYPFMSHVEFTRMLSERAGMLSEGSPTTLKIEEKVKIKEHVREKQNNELVGLFECLALGEWILKKIPLKVTTRGGRSYDPNYIECAFRPQKDHELCRQWSSLWTLLSNE